MRAGVMRLRAWRFENMENADKEEYYRGDNTTGLSDLRSFEDP